MAEPGSATDRRARLSSFAIAVSLAIWFVWLDVLIVHNTLLPSRSILGDARLYHDAAIAWLSGGDPYTVSVLGVRLAAPPTTLVPYALTAWLPPHAWIVFDAVAAALIVWRLRLGWHWLAFPPLFFATLHGSVDS